MKLISVLLCFFISLNVLASTELDVALDDYHYAMTVEWDQQDRDFYQRETEKFFLRLSNLGLEENEILSVVEKRAQGRIDIAALKIKLSLLTKNANSMYELAQILNDYRSSLYVRGSSWNGDIWVNIGMGFVVAALVGYAVWWNVKYVCVQEERYRDCRWYSDGFGNHNYDCRWRSRCLQWAPRKP